MGSWCAISAEDVAANYAASLVDRSRYSPADRSVRDTYNRPLYALILASHKKVAIDIFVDITANHTLPQAEQLPLSE